MKKVPKELVIPPEIEQLYSNRILTDFRLYWGEPDEHGIQRWQKEKTWEISRRLLRWKRNQERWDWERSQRFIKVNERPTQR